MYWMDPKATSALIVILFYLLYYAALAVGYILAWLGDRREKRVGLAVLGVGAACLLAFWAVYFKRAFYVGSREEFFAGKAAILLKVYPLFPVLLAGMTVAGVALILSSLMISGRLQKRA
jgi:MFS family permease